ncbi:MAG: PAS domain S-box protein [Nitrosomonadales bacterium]|nr:PAS domain S-box protein [Nitrosomonadales bacterium]
MDLTKHKQADAAQQETLGILQKIARQIPGVVYQFRLRPDGSTCVPYTSDAIRGIYRLGPEEVHEDASRAFANVHPDDLENHLASIQTSARDLTPWQQEYRLKFDDGAVRWLSGNAMPQREADGSTLWHGFITDITDRKRLEQGREQYLKFFLLSAEPMCIADPFGCFKRVNPAFVKLTGFSESELVAKPFLDFVLPEDRQRTTDEMMLQVAVRPSMEFENRYVCKGGDVIFLSWDAYFDKNEGVTYATARNITGRKQAEESIRAELEIRASRAAIRKLAAHAEELREDERKFIAREVHDELGQVLSVLRMDIALLKDRTGLNNAVMDGIERNMLALVDRAIQGVRNVAGNLRPPLLDMGIIAAIERQCAEFARNSGIPCPLKVVGDIAGNFAEKQALALFRIVQESLANAAHHAAATRVEITITAGNGAKIEMEIRDNGRGFDPEEHDENKSFGLLGMRERAISIGGELNIASKPGQGAVVTLRIPDDSAGGGELPNLDRRSGDRRVQ